MEAADVTVTHMEVNDEYDSANKQFSIEVMSYLSF